MITFYIKYQCLSYRMCWGQINQLLMTYCNMMYNQKVAIEYLKNAVNELCFLVCNTLSMYSEYWL